MHTLGRSMVILLSLAAGGTCFAQKSFLGLDAKSVGYGGSGVIGMDDPSSLAWNPAAIGALRESSAFFSFIRPFQINQVAAVGFIPFWGSFGANLQQTVNGQAATLGWAYAWPSSMTTGMAVQRLQTPAGQNTTVAFALMFSPGPIEKKSSAKKSWPLQQILQAMTLTAVIQNIPLDKSNVPSVIRLAGSYSFPWLRTMILYGYHFEKDHHQQQFGLSCRPFSFMEAYAGVSDFYFEQPAAGFTWIWQNMRLNTTYDFQRKEVLFSTTLRLSSSGAELSQQAQMQAQNYAQAGKKRTAFRYSRLALAYDAENEQARTLLQELAPAMAGSNVVIDSLLKAADGFNAKRWYLSAAAIYLQVLKLDSENKRALESILLIQPQVDRHIDKWFQLGRQYADQNEPATAREVFEAILLVRPNHEPARQARDEIDRVFLRKADEFYFQGLDYYSRGSWNDAEEAFKQALALKPNWPEAQSYLWHIREQRDQSSQRIAQILAEAGRFEKNREWANARKQYQEALVLDPKNNSVKEKIDELQIKLNSYVNQQFSRAEAAFRNGDMEISRRLFVEILEINPNHSSARHYLEAINSALSAPLQRMLERAVGYAKRNEYGLCVDVVDSLLAERPQMAEAQQLRKRSIAGLDATGLVELARKRYLRNRYAEALLLIQEALKKEPDQSQALSLLLQTQKRIEAQVDDLFNRGIKFYTEEKYQQAMAEFEKALAINPDHRGAIEYLRRSRERMEALDKMP
jgi:tetratricopeptide (TPR) repeat protein